jgi:hypothetical protein
VALVKRYTKNSVAGKSASGIAAELPTKDFLSESGFVRNNTIPILAIRWATLLFCLAIWGFVIAGIAAWLD